MKLFNTDFDLSINNVENAEKYLEKIKHIGNVLQKILNIFDKDSEVSKLNKDKEINASEILRDIILKSIKYEEITNLHFNTNQNFSKIKNIEINDNIVKIKNEVDFGGIAKGYFMMMIKDFLTNNFIEYELNFGGAILLSKGKEIYLRDMKNPVENIIKVKLENEMSIHTSSYYWQRDGNSSHIYVKDKGYGIIEKSISVIDKNSILADAISTALYSMQHNEILEFVRKYRIKVIYIYKNKIYISNGLVIENLCASYKKVII